MTPLNDKLKANGINLPFVRNDTVGVANIMISGQATEYKLGGKPNCFDSNIQTSSMAE